MKVETGACGLSTPPKGRAPWGSRPGLPPGQAQPKTTSGIAVQPWGNAFAVPVAAQALAQLAVALAGRPPDLSEGGPTALDAASALKSLGAKGSAPKQPPPGFSAVPGGTQGAPLSYFTPVAQFADSDDEVAWPGTSALRHLPAPPTGEAPDAAPLRHISLAQDLGSRLCLPCRPPANFVHCVAERVRLGPAGIAAARNQSLARVRRLAVALRPATDRRLACCAPHVRQVLGAVGPVPLHLDLLRQLLLDTEWPDARALVDDLAAGFRLTGEVPVSHDARA